MSAPVCLGTPLLGSVLVVDGTGPLRILGATAYPVTVASARVRLASFVSRLRACEIELDYRPALTEAEYAVLASAAAPTRKAAVLARASARTAAGASEHDLLLVHRLRLLNPLPGLDPPRRLDVYDIDDALFLGSAAEVNRHFRWAKQEARRSIACMRRASLVIAGNAYLAACAREYAGRVEVVPSCVDPDAQPVHAHAARDVVRIGWIGSSTTTAYLEPLLPVLDRLNRHRPRVKLVLVGADRRLETDWIEHHAWSLEGEREQLADFDIGVMPLPDSEWTRGKCGYKLLQYFSAGVPAVATPVGVNVELVGGERGILASSAEEWERALLELIGDVDQRSERGRAARSYVERDYSYRRWAPELGELLHSAAR